MTRRAGIAGGGARALAALALAGACALAVPDAGRAAGINLSWDDCGAAGAYRKTFACDSNTGVDVLVGSFVTPPGIDVLNGNEILLGLIADAAQLPSWWQLANPPAPAPPACRPGALQANFDFSSASGACFDYWAGRQAGGLAYTYPWDFAANTAKVIAVCAIALEDAGPVQQNLEVYSFKLLLSHASTTGATACGGCATDVCIELRSIKLTQNGTSLTGNVTLTNPVNSSLVVWQGWSSGVCFVPARATSWGAVKSLYR